MSKLGKYIVKVGAFDENYEKYYNRGALSAGLENAYGVFASMMVDSVVINFQND
ncbi:MAG: hypothetical protein ABDI07_00180 [Candidatus Kryptonium sp.]